VAVALPPGHGWVTQARTLPRREPAHVEFPAHISTTMISGPESVSVRCLGQSLMILGLANCAKVSGPNEAWRLNCRPSTECSVRLPTSPI
jgi:hypothetical protein